MPAAPPRLLILPEELRLPDLSQVRSVGSVEAVAWVSVGHRAALWGPEERNGCTRHVTADGTVEWADAQRELHSPDPWTPAQSRPDRSIVWSRHGQDHRDGDQPGEIQHGYICWPDHGTRHRPHAPAAIYHDDDHRLWRWHDQAPDDAFRALLDQAWTAEHLTSAGALTLLDRASRIDSNVEVTAPTWVGHVLNARPEASGWSADLRAWLRLLTC